MKKLLIFMLVFVMASVANAGMVDLVIVSLDGNPISPTKEITILADSQTIDLDIIYDGTNPNLGNLQVNIVAAGQGTLDMTALTNTGGPAWDPAWNYGVIENVPGKDYSLGYTMGMTGAGVASGIAIDHILLHCDDIGQVILTMTDWFYMNQGSEDGYWTGITPLTGFGQPVIVNQIPEPMTIALLGLGSLFLLRRRK